jgi:hypothetical protein
MPRIPHLSMVETYYFFHDFKSLHALKNLSQVLIQVDIGGHPPSPTGSKQFSDNFGNLLFLAVFRVLNFRSRFEALNDVFEKTGSNMDC